jgi:hypothetical protein
MTRKTLLADISHCIEAIGFTRDISEKPFTYRENVKYPSKLLGMKSDYAHFILYTPKGSLQLVAKYQETSGTAIEKLAYTALDAANCDHFAYVVVCGGKELLKNDRAIEFLNTQQHSAPKLQAITIQGLKDYLLHFLNPHAA